MEQTNTYISKFEECLNIVDYGSTEKRRDTAFLMTLQMVKARDFSAEMSNSILIELAHYAVKNDGIILNLKNEVSQETSLSLNYSGHDGVLVFLSSKGYFNIDTLKYIFNALKAKEIEYRNCSPMAESANNAPFYGFNCVTLSKCIEAAS